jgi:hypothetical protein
MTKASAGGVTTGAAGDENLLMWPGSIFEYHILGTQSITEPAWVAATGLNLGMDQTTGDGIELSQGIGAANKHAFVIGTDEAFYMKATFTIADGSGTAEFFTGFRMAEDYQAAFDDYNDAAGFNVQNGVINLETIIGDAGTTTTDTTETDWGDTEEHTLQVNVSAAGVVTYLFDGVAPTVVAAFTFADTTVVVPCVFYTQHADFTEVFTISLWEVGYQSGL